MKSLVVGAMLLRTMNAQVPAGNAVPALNAPVVGAPALGAPNLGTPNLGTPNLGAPSLGAPALGVPAVGAPAVSAPAVDVPAVGTPTAGVPVLAPVITPAINAPGSTFIAPTRPAALQTPSGVAGFPLRSLAPAVPQLSPLRSAIGAVASSLPAASSRGGSFGAFAVEEPGIPLGGDTDPLPLNAPVDVNEPAPVNDVPIPLAAPDWIPTADSAGLARPIGSNPYVGPFDPNSVYDPSSPYYDPYAQPPGWEGDDNGIYDGEDDDDYQGGKGPGYGDDDDYEECPAWCLHEDDSYDSYDPYPTPDYEYSPYKPTPTPEYPEYSPVADPYPEYKETPEYDPYPQKPTYKEEPYPAPTPDYKEEPQYYPEPEDKKYPQLKRVRSILRAVRRQVYNWGQPAYSDDDDSGSYDGEDGSIPDWLYDISGAPKRPTPAPKPKCPKSCHKPKQDDYGYGTKPARPTYTKTRKGGYETTEDPYEATKAPYGQGNSTVYWPTGPTSVPDGPTSIPDDSTSVPDEPTSVPDEPTSIPYEPTTAYYEPTTLVTQYQPQPYPAETGYGSSDSGYSSSDPGSPAGDYTGDTLDTLCPNTCNPFNPAENFCDITTGCATTGGSKYYCACRAGFRADNYNAKDFSKQFKVAGQPYVYLAVSTSCNTPCSDSTCSEVLERNQCK